MDEKDACRISNNIGAPVVEQGTKIDSDGIMSRSRGRDCGQFVIKVRTTWPRWSHSCNGKSLHPGAREAPAALSVPAPLLRWKERDVCFWEGRYQMLAQV